MSHHHGHSPRLRRFLSSSIPTLAPQKLRPGKSCGDDNTKLLMKEITASFASVPLGRGAPAAGEQAVRLETAPAIFKSRLGEMKSFKDLVERVKRMV
jgi:hypothetical protein